MSQLYVEGLYEIIPLKGFRNTPGVKFHMAPEGRFKSIDSIDRVEHGPDAVSPGSLGGVERPWYYHKAQTDCLIVFKGERVTELYTPAHGRIETFTVTPQFILRDDVRVYDGPAFLSWPAHVFHRVRSGKEGSLSINIAKHHEGFSLADNFDIYDADISTGAFKVLRQGHLDQS